MNAISAWLMLIDRSSYQYYIYPHRFNKWWKNCFVYIVEIAIHISYTFQEANIKNAMKNL